MSRPRLALIFGTLLLASATVTSCCAAVVPEPQPLWDDPVAEQAQWNSTPHLLMAAACCLLLASIPLLAYGIVGLRMEWRAQVEARVRRPQH